MENNLNKKRLTSARRVLFFSVFLMTFALAFLAGYSARDKGLYLSMGSKGAVNIDSGKPKEVDFSLFWEAWNVLRSKSVQTTDSTKMTEGAIAGMMASLDDPYTVYFSKEENKRFREDIQGEFFGIGIELVQKNNLPTVVTPLADSPAEKAGLKPGDIIVDIDGISTENLSYEETVDKIRGADGTKVNLKIIREKVQEPLTFSVTRGKITVKSVEWNLKREDGKKYEYIKLRQFGDDTEELFKNAASDIEKNNPDGVIIDLRNNPGGYLETAVNIASYFVKDGVIVSEKGKNGEKKDYNSNGNGRLLKYKTVILANDGSASAAEILAGALQDRAGDKVVGEKTFGKGSVQELVELSNGAAVKVTVASWFTPNGRQINKSGIEPDIKVSDPESTPEDEQLIGAMNFLKTSK